MAYVYRHIRLDTNEVFYVGIGEDSIKRCGKFYRAYKRTGRTKWWINIISKTPYEVEIMLDDLTWEEACEKEKEFIKLYGRRDLGLGTLVNLTDGGSTTKGYIVTETTKGKIRDSNKGRKVSLITKARISASSKGRSLSQEVIDNLVKIHTGRKRSKVTCDNISNALKGKSHIGRYVLLHLDTGVYYNSISQAASAVGISYSNLRDMLLKPNRENTTSIVIV